MPVYVGGMQVCVACRNADLQAILSTDVSQLGQVPRLHALSLNSLRMKLIKELEMVISQMSCRACICCSGSCPYRDGKTKQVRWKLVSDKACWRLYSIPVTICKCCFMRFIISFLEYPPLAQHVPAEKLF